MVYLIHVLNPSFTCSGFIKSSTDNLRDIGSFHPRETVYLIMTVERCWPNNVDGWFESNAGPVSLHPWVACQGHAFPAVVSVKVVALYCLYTLRLQTFSVIYAACRTTPLSTNRNI